MQACACISPWFWAVCKGIPNCVKMRNSAVLFFKSYEKSLLGAPPGARARPPDPAGSLLIWRHLVSVFNIQYLVYSCVNEIYTVISLSIGRLGSPGDLMHFGEGGQGPSLQQPGQNEHRVTCRESRGGGCSHWGRCTSASRCPF